ncbi:MAG TPA: hypothetical protein VFQ29_10360 [Methyloceanibacter sp.]|jgi:hypothetical protein|nr:hypothetical protein [Methyloceanibacter sp.]
MDYKLADHAVKRAANAARWALHGSWPDALYWSGAAVITVAVTWGYAR